MRSEQIRGLALRAASPSARKSVERFYMLQRFSDHSVAIMFHQGGKWFVDRGWPIDCMARRFAGQQNRWIKPWFPQAVLEAEIARVDEIAEYRRAA